MPEIAKLMFWVGLTFLIVSLVISLILKYIPRLPHSEQLIRDTFPLLKWERAGFLIAGLFLLITFGIEDL